MAETITRPGAILPVEIRTARKRHVCDDCHNPIEPGDRYELSVSPPHRVQEWDSERWMSRRTHYPRHDGSRVLLGCAEAAAYREKAAREQRAMLISAGLLKDEVSADA